MVFNSLHFVFFFIIVTSLFYLLPHKYRWFLLLASSCYFYMVFLPIYILILGFTIVVDYFAGILLEDTSGKKRKIFLIASLFANIGMLAIFKYYNFLNDNLTALLHTFDIHNPVPYLSILLPIGLSFHTFQAMSYTIEVYRGNQKAERTFGIYALYVMFYPQLVAGPIERPQNLIHQFYETHSFDTRRIVDGLKQMLWGLFKKVVIADRLAIYVSAVYNNEPHHSGQSFWLATIFFTVQVYCDFSGYSDIAIGAARVMGFKLMTNFKRPFFAASVAELWQRWHISLTSWFKDYLYIPLGGNRVAKWRWYFNIFFVFLISGLWHGAAWTYIIFGALHGIYLITPLLFSKLWAYFPKTKLALTFPRVYKSINIFLAFFLFACSLSIFRALSITDVISFWNKMIHFTGPVFIGSPSDMAYCILGIIFLFVVEFEMEYKVTGIRLFYHPSIYVRYTSYMLLIVLILMVGVVDGGQFIYFQF